MRALLSALTMLGMMTGCKAQPVSQTRASATPKSIEGVGISTEHQLSGVSQTACGYSAAVVEATHRQGFYYIAVPEPYFGDGALCGVGFEITIGGACYDHSNVNCTSNFAAIAAFASADGGNTPNTVFKAFVADLCGSCVSQIPHLDIIDQVYKPAGPLGDLRRLLDTKIQTAHDASGRTAQPNNLYIKSIKRLDQGPSDLPKRPW